MLIEIKNRIFQTWKLLTSTIAFLPTAIALLFVVFAAVMVRIEDESTTKFLLDNAPFLVINNAETARSILGTLIGGVISLTVFSFSMVMIILNQASSSFSPRLLPGLITDRKNQVVLGFYLGTIIYCIIAMISILPSADTYTLNGFTILLGIIFGINCLGLFVFFIHTISQNIQIEIILGRIYKNTRERLLELGDMDRHEVDLDDDDFEQTLYTKKAGYYQDVNLDSLKELADQFKMNFKVAPHPGKYMLPNEPLIFTQGSIDDEQKETILSTFIFDAQKDERRDYTLGIKQITEVGVKAMSPGINDPGTAIITLDYLTELFALRMKLDDQEIYASESEEYRIELTTINFKELLYQHLAAYRQYCKHDVILMRRILKMLKYLDQQECRRDQYHEEIREQIKIIGDNIEQNIENEYDAKDLLEMINKE